MSDNTHAPSGHRVEHGNDRWRSTGLLANRNLLSNQVARLEPPGRFTGGRITLHVLQFDSETP